MIGIFGNEGTLNGIFEGMFWSAGMFWSRWRAAAVLVGVVENEIRATRRASAKQGLRAAIVVEYMPKGVEGILGA